jgi:hypothetical protein
LVKLRRLICGKKLLWLSVTYPEDTIGAVGKETHVTVDLLEVQLGVWQYSEWSCLLQSLSMGIGRRVLAVA